MKKSLGFLGTTFAIATLTLSISAQLTVQTIDVAGDSIMKGFNAGNSAPCANADQETFNWLTSRTHGSAFCVPGSENVFSVLERMECDAGGSLFTAFPNHAASGARMLADFQIQANNIKTYLNTQPAQRMAVVFLGHNDACSGSLNKINASCSSSDLDPNSYCRTKPDAFERELRRGLDILMSVPDSRIAIVAPVRLSQLCNFGTKTNCAIGGSCQTLWGLANICGSLTRDCSTTRIIDAYETMKSFREILKRVAAEYALIPDGGTSPVVSIGGASVGGGTKAAGTGFIYSDATWYYKFNANQLSCCDCFHPSGIGQDTLAQVMKAGLNCSRIRPCCKDSGDSLTDGKCLATERKWVYYRGLF